MERGVDVDADTMATVCMHVLLGAVDAAVSG